MACLGAVSYDPAAVVTKSCAALLAMTALDTTNLRIPFTVPANGCVLVRLRGVLHGSATSSSQILLGVLDGSTVRLRTAPMSGRNGTGTAVMRIVQESVAVVTGLTPGASLTWDAAYGVEFVVASSDLKYGGPNDTTANNAHGAFEFEVWETTNLLGAITYDPATAVSKSTATLLAMTALDTTNLRMPAFTVPASGKVLVRLRCMLNGATSVPGIFLGVLDGATIKGRVAPFGGPTENANPLATSHSVFEGEFVVNGLTPGASITTWDAAYAVENIVASTQIRYGGPNDTTQDNAYGAFAFEVWAA